MRRFEPSQAAMKAAIAEGLRQAAPARTKLRCCAIECAGESDRGSVGAHYVVDHARRAGFHVEQIAPDSNAAGYDVELVSVHHPSDWGRLAAMPKRGRVRLLGGHTMAINPRPGIPMCDAVCVGEGESWIVEALTRLEEDCRGVALEGLPGTIVSSSWDRKSDIPEPNVERPLPDNPPYLNRANTLGARWYIEIARGCPFRCAYCELGHTVAYRYYDVDYVLGKLAAIDGRSSKVNLLAPDEGSHPHYNEIMAELRRLKHQQAFGSYRIDRVLAEEIVPYSASQLVRVGVDGLSDEIREKVGKRISNAMIVEFFRKLSNNGHVAFKIFMMFGYPWESPAAFDEWAATMDRVLSIPVRRNCHLRIKWTPLIPQPRTPLACVRPTYDLNMAQAIMDWHARHNRIKSPPGWSVSCDGMMSANTYYEHARATWGDETLCLDRAQWVNPTWRTL